MRPAFWHTTHTQDVREISFLSGFQKGVIDPGDSVASNRLTGHDLHNEE